MENMPLAEVSEISFDLLKLIFNDCFHKHVCIILYGQSKALLNMLTCTLSTVI